MTISLPTDLQPLIELPHWIVWKWQPSKKRGAKPKKVPYQARQPNRKAENNNSATWATYDQAVAVVAAGQAAGIGFALTGTPFGALDLDDCRNKNTGAIVLPWAQTLVDNANSYAEASVSGTGVHIIGYVEGEEVHRKWPRPGGGACEVYRKATRFLYMSGQRIGTAGLGNIDAVIDALVAELSSSSSSSSASAPDIDAAPVAEEIKPDDPRLAKLAPKWIALGFHGEGIDQQHRSRSVFAFVCECLRAEIEVKVIAALLMQWKIGEHVREQNNVRRALIRVISNAKLKVENSDLYEMNQQHAVLPIGGKTRVATWGKDPDFPDYSTIVRFAAFSDFRNLYDKYRIEFPDMDKNGNPITVTMGRGSWWLSQRHRRQYDDGMRFMPESDEDVVGDTLNLWQGFGVLARKPEGGSGASGSSKFLDHGLKIICSGNEEHFAYLIKREAFIAQRRTRSEVAVALRTEIEGTGKGVWSRSLNHLYGIHAMQVQKPEHVIGKHNKHLEVLLRLTADEALFALDPRHRNALYGLITEPTTNIEPKFVDSYLAKNHINIDITTNARHYVPVSGSARRFMVPTVSAERAGDHAYFAAIITQLNDGGYEALLYHLLYEVDIRDFNVRNVPKTAALAEQAAYSRQGVERLVEIACSEAQVPCAAYWANYSDCTGNEERRGFDYFIDHNADRELQRMGSLSVKRCLKEEWDCKTGRETRKRAGYQNVRGVIWPPLQELREKFVGRFGPQQWLSEVEEWQEPKDVIKPPSEAEQKMEVELKMFIHDYDHTRVRVSLDKEMPGRWLLVGQIKIDQSSRDDQGRVSITMPSHLAGDWVSPY